MTTIEAIQQELAPEIRSLNEMIEQRLKSSNDLMTSVITSYLRTKGKQIRPILVILTARLFGNVNPLTIAAAAAVEMLHNATLIHDDVVDESKMRRGNPTINSIWDNQIAVLVGDFFLSTSLGIIADTGDANLFGSLARLGRMLSIGELDQIYNAQRHCFSEEDYFTVISRKTASLFVTCVEMGAYTAGACEDDVRRMARVAELLGLCFQIRDDIFDYYASSEVGKPTGNDLREGKITLPLLYALSRTDHPDHDRMAALVASDSLTEPQIATLISYAKDAGGIEYAYRRMEQLSAEAMGLLDKLPQTDATQSFRTLISYIIRRTY